MKGAILSAAVAAAGSASAAGMHRHAHELFHAKRGEMCTPGCTTIYTTITGEATWKPVAAPTSTPAVVPTPIPQVCPTPGTYTFPATSVVVTAPTTVCGASTTKVPKGTHTLGGVTTAVTTSTIITCPYATTTTKANGKVDSVIETTTYVCPSAGTYTIGPITTTVTKTEEVVVCPVVTSYAPGTYTAPAVVTTVTETDVVVYCPFDIPSATPVPTPASYPTGAPAKPSSTPSSTPSSGYPKKLGGGKTWAITYTPYDESGSCKSAEGVMADLTDIKAQGFSVVRTYSTDCNGLETISAACKATGLKMIIGVFIGKPGCDNNNPDVATQIAAIKAWGQWDLVEMVVVGNEAGNQGFCTPEQLKTLILEVKEIVVAGGCHAPVTTTDTVNIWVSDEWSKVLCPVVDVVACNSHAYFDAGVTPANAGSFVKGQLEMAKAACGGKDGYVIETGWPSAGKTNGVATCSAADQAIAIKSIVEAIGSECVLFSYTNDHWKDPGACGCEQNWGIKNLFGSL